MTPNEAASTARLGGRVASGITAHVENVHQGIAQRVFGTLGPVASPVRVVHDGVATMAYRSIGAALKYAGVAAGTGLRAVVPANAGSLDAHPAANQALAALNAVAGAGLAAEGDALAITMAVRHNGRDVPVHADHLARAFPEATPAIAVFLHGLGENENAWKLRAGGESITYGSRLAIDAGLTPVYVRYNTGRHISDNGGELSGLLATLVDVWPVEVERLVLIGHSMGGLVARSACHLGSTEGRKWTHLTSDVVYLGSPHGGARLARSARLVASALSKLPETRAWAAPLDASPGIRDLRHGYISADDWAACDAGACLEDHGSNIPLLPTVNHYAVSATVVADPQTRAGRVVGDLLVQPASAHGRRPGGHHLSFLDRVNVAGRHHFSLLNDTEVYRAMRSWLAPVAASEVTGS